MKTSFFFNTQIYIINIGIKTINNYQEVNEINTLLIEYYKYLSR